MNNSPNIATPKASVVEKVEEYKPFEHEAKDFFLVWVSGESEWTTPLEEVITTHFDDRWRIGWKIPGTVKLVTDDGMEFALDGTPMENERFMVDPTYRIKAFAKLPEKIS